ncbi:16S rRNA (guanine(966)-N(2))-methyltransferase RsmD [Ramlibacter alkalitolerans]|uniref:16S rRNA (Guanine(966)-N(2))-methyltransferase RsmD n=1 Tax=Ramlibacter alkalitolerans TaxID=2039631 RepID=A0ABS1JRB1_9BURK|nr:16S rRNA (guanine(966)-N(2))-methyltransferase RsmD [Ramlibacter alkalitolerans]MBL0426686.1 16S rRNA (guanine(966)-N(2))-methyltransferase RsmD [Ramlibacter alkalitolerans]
MPRPASPPARRSLPHQVRIIGGHWKRTKLEVPDRPGLRPTPDRVRETLFNWLGQDLAGWRCVDAFAGTGALGLEAASRGAADVLLVEADGALVDALRAVIKRLDAVHVRVQRGNALTLLAGLPAGATDLVFLDPPFEADLFDKALAATLPALAPQGLIYLEAPTPWEGEALARHGLEVQRHLRAGAVHGHLLRRAA